MGSSEKVSSFIHPPRTAWICVTHRWCEGWNSINRASCSYQGLFFASHNITCPADSGPVGMHREPSDTAIGRSLERGWFCFFPFSAHSTPAFQHSHPTNLSLISGRHYPALWKASSRVSPAAKKLPKLACPHLSALLLQSDSRTFLVLPPPPFIGLT